MKNLEPLIAQFAEVIATEMTEAARVASSEEDVRHTCNAALDRFVDAAGLKIAARHEYSLAGGRLDSKYAGILIEYKSGKGVSSIASPAGSTAVVRQLKSRFRSFEKEEHVAPEKLFGVGLDGATVVFVRFRKTFEIDGPLPVNGRTIERLLRALVSLGATGKSFTSDNLAGDFGAGSAVGLRAVPLLLRTIQNMTDPKAGTFYGQWKVLFGEICGYDVNASDEKIAELANAYRVSPDVRPADLLFAIHTYYAVFMKLLSAQIAFSINPVGVSPIKRCVNTPTPAKLRKEMESLEKGGIWWHQGITNFLEGDLFSWYVEAWSDAVAVAIGGLVGALDQYDPSTLSVAPDESRDLLKELYQQLFPRSVRHDLGEYYTPDWLAEHVLDAVGYDGNPDARVLDPSCGSGTFLVLAVNRAKKWFREHRDRCGYGDSDFVTKLLRNIVGFDLNPLAVMAARTNFLMSIREYLQYAERVELPVYLCDSVLTPSEYGGLFAGAGPAEIGKARELPTTVGKFLVPTEVTSSSDVIGRYAELLEECVRNKCTPEEFVETCRSNNVPAENVTLHAELFAQIMHLETLNQNGIWARIIKNAFAPVFVDRMDFVVGNPPWITFEHLPVNYRPDLIRLFDVHFNLFQVTGVAARHGGSSIDISAVFPYVATSRYLKRGGKIGFVITQTLFQSVAASGFRRFTLPSGERLRVDVLHDFVQIRPFDGAANKTAVVVFTDDATTKYPVPCTKWVWNGRRPAAAFDLSLVEVQALTIRTPLEAVPISKADPMSPWLITTRGLAQMLRKVQGACEYHPHKGCDTSGANAIYWVEVIGDAPHNRLLVRNLGDEARVHKFESVEHAIEAEFVYPLLRGRDVRRWSAVPSASILCAQQPGRFAHAYPEADLKRIAPKLFSYFSIPVFEQRLRRRAGYVKYLAPSGAPFYALYDIKNYTEAKWKVVVREQATHLTAAVVAPTEGRPTIPDHKLSLIATESEGEADFVAGVLNSVPVRLLIREFGISTQISVSTLGYVRIPRFDGNSTLHQAVANYSRAAREAVSRGDRDGLRAAEESLNIEAATLWNLGSGALERMGEAIGKFDSADPTEASDVEVAAVNEA